MSLAALLAVSGLFAAVPTLAAGNTLHIESPTISAITGHSFTIRVVANTDVDVSGAQASVVFDTARIQITALTIGADWIDAGAGYVGYPSPAHMTSFLATANASGKVPSIATFFTAGGLPAGNHDLLSVTFGVIGCGDSTIELPIGPGDGSLLDGRMDTYGEDLPMSSAGATVSVACDESSPSRPAAPSSGPGAGVPNQASAAGSCPDQRELSRPDTGRG